MKTISMNNENIAQGKWLVTRRSWVGMMESNKNECRQLRMPLCGTSSVLCYLQWPNACVCVGGGWSNLANNTKFSHPLAFEVLPIKLICRLFWLWLESVVGNTYLWRSIFGQQGRSTWLPKKAWFLVNISMLNYTILMTI